MIPCHGASENLCQALREHYQVPKERREAATLKVLEPHVLRSTAVESALKLASGPSMPLDDDRICRPYRAVYSHKLARLGMHILGRFRCPFCLHLR